jgi:hypothetical protein
VGDTVSFSFKRGPTPVFNTPPTEPNPTVVAKVLVIDHCLREGDKYGNKVVAINCRDRRYGFFSCNLKESIATKEKTKRCTAMAPNLYS